MASDYHAFALVRPGEHASADDQLERSEWQLRDQRPLSDFFDAHAGSR